MKKDAKKVQIKHISELPDWFQLSKYDSAKQLDATGWYEQLLVRYHLQKSFDRLQECLETEDYAEDLDIDIVDHVFAKIQENPIVNVTADELLADLLTEERIGNTLSELNQKRPHYSLGVHNITVSELLDIEDAAGEPLEKIKQQIETYMDALNDSDESDDEPSQKTRQEWKNDIRAYHKEVAPPSSFEPWIDSPLHKLTSNPCSILQEAIRINWNHPDTILIENFKQFLKSHRPASTMINGGNEEKSFLKKCYRKSNFNEWHRLGILPYFDLKLWALEEHVVIPYRVIADAIYPHGEGGEETVRKTTLPPY